MLSVGIDIGTTTTQLVFSEIIVQNTAGAFLIPKVKIVDKNLIYKSDIYFTPLVSKDTIDLIRLKRIIENEYKKACIRKKDISTGAIIMTGETARKFNAHNVLNILSEFAGDFVVATAGADFESILAGFGSGAFDVSKNISGNVINFDIGGGTTNACLFENGEVRDCFALDIGGRLVRIKKNGTITYVSERIKNIIRSLGLDIQVGYKANVDDLHTLAKKFADIILKIGNNKKLLNEEAELFIGHENNKLKSDLLMFSGGVSEFIYGDERSDDIEEVLQYGDIGPMIGRCMRDILKEKKYSYIKPKEKIRATVIGAGSYSVKISGSTIVFETDILPIKNVPIIKIKDDLLKNKEAMCDYILKKINMYSDSNVAISFTGPESPSYSEIGRMADEIIECFKIIKNSVIIVITENDFAKALGQTLRIKTGFLKKIICLDGISTENGDYIDIGNPILGAIPVSVKTLIFND